MKKLWNIWLEFRAPFQISLRLFTKKDRTKFWLLVTAQMATGFLDLIGAGLISLVVMLLISAFQGPESIPYFLDLVVDNFPIRNLSPIQMAVTIGLFSAAFFIIKSILSVILLRKNLRFLGLRHSKIVGDLLSSLLNKNLLFIESKASQDLSYALLQGTSYLTIELLAPLAIGLTEATLLILFATLMFFVDPYLMVCVVLFFGIVGTSLHRYLGGWALEVGEEVARANSSSFRKLQETLENFRTLKVLGKEEYFLKDIEGDVRQGAMAHSSRRFIEQIPKFTLEVTLILGILALGFSQLSQQDLASSSITVVIFLTIAVRSTPSMLRLQSVFISLRNAKGQSKETIEFIQNLWDEPNQIPKSTELITGKKPFPTILLSDISFTYPGNSVPTIQKLSFELLKNQSLAIVGRSGAGKSTLVDIILGILSPQEGEVVINSLDPTSAISMWRNEIVYIPQETMLLSKSIAENIAFGVPDNEIDLDRIWKSLEVVQLSEFVMSLPDQLNTQIGAVGIKLSGGQKQRIGLSRAVYLEPKILFLDEATSALDSITESQISSTIQEIAKRSTVVVIAHRLSTVKAVDRVLYLEKGKAGVFGTFDEVNILSEGFAAQINLL